jgi:hypothetical protein
MFADNEVNYIFEQGAVYSTFMDANYESLISQLLPFYCYSTSLSNLDILLKYP